MYSAELLTTIEAPWLSMEPIKVDPERKGRGTPGVYLVIRHGGEPFARADVWPSSAGPFTQVEVWKRFVVVGWSQYAHLIDPAARTVQTIDCGDYFGHLYPLDERLLVATPDALACVDAEGTIAWKSDHLGIDGVIVDRVGDGVIEGQGEWDPPGGWRPFRVFLASGTQVEARRWFEVL